MPRVVPSQVVRVIDQLFPWASTQVEGRSSPPYLSREYSGRVAAITTLVQQIPPELIVLDDERYAELVVSVATLQDVIPRWQLRDDKLERVPGLRRLNPITLVRQALAACPDAFPSSQTTGLKFIPDADLRENLRIDMSTTERAFSNSEWKAATVLAALLLWALQQQSSAKVSAAVKNLVARKTLPSKPKPKLEDWALHQYIEVAAELPLISNGTANQARLAQGFRNLIHPGAVQRLGQTCDRGAARSALAAVDLIVRELETLFP